MMVLNELDKNSIFTYKDVDLVLGRLCNENGYVVDFEVIEGTLVDSYLIDISMENDTYDYCLFVEKYINEWNSGLEMHFIKDDGELKEKFPWIVEDIERQREED